MTRRLMIGVALTAAAFVAILAFPNFIHNCPNPANAFLSNLRQLDGATLQWSLDNHKTNGEIPVIEELRPYFSQYQKFPACPLVGTYALGTATNPPQCTYPGHRLQ